MFVERDPLEREKLLHRQPVVEGRVERMPSHRFKPRQRVPEPHHGQDMRVGSGQNAPKQVRDGT